MPLDWLAGILGTSKATVLAGGAGAGIAAMLSRRKKIERAITFIVGFGCATFGTSTLIAWLSLDSVRFEGGLGFILGLFGMSLCEAIIRVIEQTNWGDIIKGKFGGDK